MSLRGVLYKLFSLGWMLSTVFADETPRIERWELYTSLLTVRSVASDGHRLWVATTGGLFTYEPVRGEIVPIRRIEGLLVHDFTAIAADTHRGLVLAGASDGTVELCELPGNWEHILDIRNHSGISDKRITGIVLAGRRAYVGTVFGLVVLDIPTRTVEQSTYRIGPFPVGTPVSALAVWNDSLWVGTPVGLAAVPIGAAMVNYPPIWRRVWDSGVSALSPGPAALGIAAADRRVLSYAAGSVSLLRQYEQPVVGIVWVGDSLFVATQNEFWQEQPVPRQLPMPASSPSGLWGGVVGGEIYLALAVPDDGVWYWSNRQGAWRHVRPNTPHTNLLLSCAIDTAGTLWCATDRGAGRGFACLFRGLWYSFTTATHPQLRYNEYHRVSISPLGEIWFAGWGGGLVRVVPSDTGFALERYDVSNTPLRGTPGDTGYLPIGELAFDAEGNLWGICHWCVTGALFQRTVRDGVVRPVLTSLPLSQRQNYPLVIDPFGTKWFGSLVGDGLFYYREATASASEIWGRVTTANAGLPSNIQYALAIDHEGMVWVGTPSGVGVVLNPSAALTGATPVVRNVSLLRDQAVYGIAVDVSNNKWLATDNGVWVVNPEGTTVLLHLTAENSPLPSNQVRSVMIEHRTGRVVVGTRAGVAILWTSARLPQAHYGLRCHPQPFVPERDELLTIDGLAERSIVQVLTLEGALVARFQSQSRTIYWDGRNMRGELVPAGVYVITALSETSGETAQAKVLVLRP